MLKHYYRVTLLDISVRYGLNGRGYLSRQTLGPTLPPVPWVMGLFPGGKAAGAWNSLPTPHLAPRDLMASYRAKFTFEGAQSCERQLLASPCLSVCLSSWNNSTPPLDRFS